MGSVDGWRFFDALAEDGSCSLEDIHSTLGADGLSAPITCMPFGRHLPALAVEGESKQSCVIFSFYFMSVASTADGGRNNLVNLYLTSIIIIQLLFPPKTVSGLLNNS